MTARTKLFELVIALLTFISQVGPCGALGVGVGVGVAFGFGTAMLRLITTTS